MIDLEKKPRLRFKGFTEAWEQRKYESLGQSFSGGSLSYEDLNENGSNDCILYGELYTHFDCVIKDTFYKTNKIALTIYKNDILFPQSTTVDAYSLISPACFNGEKAETAGVFIIRPNQDVDGNFVTYYSKGNNRQKIKLSKKAQGLTIVHLYYQSIKDETLYMPHIKEQKQISTLFIQLDTLITLHQRKYEKLRSMKTALLEKMFPAGNETTPKIRFKGFTEAWEQRKLDELIVRIGTGLNPRDNFVLNNGGKNYYVTIKNFEHGHLYLDDNCDKVDDDALKIIQNRSDLQINDILFTSIGRIGDCYLIKKQPKDWNINESVFTLRPNKNEVKPEYLFHVIHSEIVLNQILNDVTGSTFKSIKIGDLKKAVVPITNKSEQVKLAKFITELDSLITLHQRKQYIKLTKT